MTIKTKLTLMFSFFIGLISLLVICLISGLFLQRIYFIQYVDVRDKIATVEDIIQTLNSQKLHFDYYILFSEDKEKDNFSALTAKIEELINVFLSEEKKDIVEKYKQFVKNVDKAFTEQYREKRVTIAVSEVLPVYKNLSDELQHQVKLYRNQEKKIQKFVLLLNISSWAVSIIVIIIALVVTFKYGVRIYHSLINSLKIITSFANVLSKGEYKEINATTDDEFSEVFSAFNLTIKNLKNLQAQVIQMDRLSNIGQLAGGIAHEINNPLVGVLGQAQILLEKIPQDSPIREHVLKIERAAKRCRESVAKLLQFSRQKEYEYVEANINEVIDNVLFIADSELKAYNIEVVKLFQFSMPKIKISIPHIQQAILNIVNNAIQAIDAKKEGQNMLIIKTYTTKIEENTKSTEYVVIEIQDTGCGIEQKNLNSIFEPFFTTKDRNKFAGIGLAITKDIILHHKGKITVFSEGINKGAKFVIYLPCEN